MQLFREKEPDQKKTEKNRGQRELDGSIKAVEGNDRSFLLSFSSEEPYERWFGPEILDHSEGCVNLERLNSIGCVLFNHDRDKVCGKIKRAWVEDGRGYAEIEFDTDEKSEVIYQKVLSGTLKGVSVGYMVDEWEEVMQNKTSEDGRFSGRCSIAKKWTPFEISVVSVPADPTVGVGRELQEEQNGKTTNISMFEKQLQINKNILQEEM